MLNNSSCAVQCLPVETLPVEKRMEACTMIGISAPRTISIGCVWQICKLKFDYLASEYFYHSLTG